MKNIFIKAPLTTAILSVMLLSANIGPAWAVSTESECNAKIREAEQMLITATVSNENLMKIANSLDEAKKLCASGQFSSAEIKIDENVDFLKSSSSQ